MIMMRMIMMMDMIMIMTTTLMTTTVMMIIKMKSRSFTVYSLLCGMSPARQLTK